MAAIQFNYNSLAASFRGNQPDPPLSPRRSLHAVRDRDFHPTHRATWRIIFGSAQFHGKILNKFESRHSFVSPVDPYANEAQIRKSSNLPATKEKNSN